MNITVNIQLDEDMLESALTTVHSRLARIESKLDDFVEYEVEEDIMEEFQMGVVSDRVEGIRTEVAEQRTVLESLQTWATGERELLEQVRADLATAIANGATEEDLAALDEVISALNDNTATVEAVMENTPEGPTEPTDPTV